MQANFFFAHRTGTEMGNQQNELSELYEVILQNPSRLGQLIYIASRWNTCTGRYDRDLPDRFRSREADEAIAKWHRTFFVEWLALPLAQKEQDVALYWRSIGGNRDQIKLIREQGEAGIPPLVRWEERSLFIQDLSFVLALL